MFALHSFPDVSGPQYDAAADDQTVVFVQIESKSGLESVEKIAAVPGLDGVLIGESANGCKKPVHPINPLKVPSTSPSK